MQNLSRKRIHGLTTCRLLSSVLNDTEPPEIPEGITLDALYSFQKRQDVANMTYVALKKLGYSAEELKEFADDYKLMLLREARFELASEQVFDALEKAEIPFIPIKGVILKKMYPNPSLRSFTDTDIYTGDSREDVIKVMLELGYEYKGAAEYVDEFTKKPSLYFEMHHRLFGARDSFDGYFDEPFSRTVVKDGMKFYRVFKNDDFFIHVLCHLYKHFTYGGCGLRQFMDIYVMRKKMTLDMDYINAELEKLGLDGFFDTTNRLNAFLFDGDEPTDDLLEIADYVFNNGTFGTIENIMANDFKDDTEQEEHKNIFLWKAKYFSKRWGLSFSGMKKQFSILGKLPFLLPLFYVYKLLRAVFVRRGTIKSQIHDIEGMNSEHSEYVEHIMEISKVNRG